MIISTNITINVNDLGKSVQFYQTLGFELIQRWGDHYAQVKASGIILGLHPRKGNTPDTTDNISIGFTSDDFESEKQMLTDAGIDFEIRQEAGGSFLHFTDPDGTSLYFIKPKE